MPARLRMHAIKALYAAALIAFGVYLAWEVLLFGVTRELAYQDPDAAIEIDPRDGVALAEAAEAQLALAKTPADFERAGLLARRALIAAPLEPAPLRVLAHEAERAGRSDKVLALRELISQRTRRDNENENWLFGVALNRADYSAAFAHADALMRQDLEAVNYLAPPLVLALEDRRALRPMAETLSADPPWRTAFLRHLTSQSPDPQLAAEALAALSATRRPTTEDEVRPLIARLVREQQYAAARRTWRALLPANAPDGLLYDAALTGAPGGAPFNWRFENDSAASVMIVDDPDHVRVLHAQDQASGGGELAEQMLVLAPGAYRFSGLIRFEGPDDHPLWRVQCAPNGELIGQSHPTGRSPGWRAFSVSFAVPVEGCPAQWLRLRATSREGFEPTEAWFARLKVERD